MYHLKSLEDFRPGEILDWAYPDQVRLFRHAQWGRPIGFAAKHFKRGDVLRFDPEENTEDIIIRGGVKITI